MNLTENRLLKIAAIFVVAFVVFFITAVAINYNLELYQAQVPPPVPSPPIKNCLIQGEIIEISIPSTSRNSYQINLKITDVLSPVCYNTVSVGQNINSILSYTEFQKASPFIKRGAKISGVLNSVSGSTPNLTNIVSLTPPSTVPYKTYNMALKKGWNVISIPVNAKKIIPNYSLNSAVPVNQFTVNDIKGCVIKDIVEFLPQSNSWRKPTYLNAMKGYVVTVENDCNATISGYRYNQTIQLYKGWNLFSSKYSWNEINLKSLFSTQKSCFENSKILYYDNAEQKLVEISETSKLDDTKGYWIQLPNNCSLTEMGLDDTIAPPTNPPPPPVLSAVDIKANNSDGPVNLNYGSSVTISWTSSNTISCSITPGNYTGTSGTQTVANLNASTTFNITCTAPGGNVTDNVTVNVQQTQLNIPLKKGWNMISIPVNSKTGALQENIFTPSDIKNCDIKAIWEYDTKNNKFIQPTYLNAMKGYWAYVENDCSAAISGFRSNQALQIFNGWNMISSKYSWNDLNNWQIPSSNVSGSAPPPPPTTVLMNLPVANPVKCALNSKIYNLNPTTNQLTEIPEHQALDDKKGYWVNVANDCHLIESELLNPPPPPVVPSAVDIKANNSDGPITLSYGSSVTISWTSSNTISCSVTPGNYTGTSGTQIVANLNASTTFNITCTTSSGTVTDNVVVNVRPAQTQTPTISQLNPVSGNIDTKVKITGTNFTPNSNTVRFGTGFISNLNSSANGTEIEFNVPGNLNICSTVDFSLADSLPDCSSSSPAVAPGVYPVSVTNANGSSNSINFTVVSNLTGQALPFETMLRGATSISPERASYVVKEPVEYEEMWFKHFGRISRPFVDFSNKMLLAVFAGTKRTGGYGIEINKALYDKDKFTITVYVREYIPDVQCNTTTVENQPYHIVMLDKNYAKVSFKVEQEIRYCQ